MTSRSDLIKRYPLDGVGTRLEHYNELREVFALGVQALLELPDATRDRTKLTKLQTGVELLDNRIDILSGWDTAKERTSSFSSQLRQMDLEWQDGSGDWVPKRLMGEVLDETQRRTEENTVDQADGTGDFPEGWATH